jgi:hypothetical protein
VVTFKWGGVWVTVVFQVVCGPWEVWMLADHMGSEAYTLLFPLGWWDPFSLGDFGALSLLLKAKRTGWDHVQSCINPGTPLWSTYWLYLCPSLKRQR